MSLLNWFSNPKKFKRFEDSFALNRSALYANMRDAVCRRMEQQEIVFLIAHFQDIFTELTEQLDDWQLEYEIVTTPVDQNWFRRLPPESATQCVYVTLAELLIPQDSGIDDGTASNRIAMMVAERHPRPARDAQIESFARKLVYPVQLGYFLSLDDVVIKGTIDARLIELLTMMGLKEHELVTSKMISNRLDKQLKRMQGADQRDLAADCAETWFELNRPESSQANDQR